jgi:hypothetical protein
VNIMAPYVVYWLLQVMCPFFQPLHVHVMPVMGSLSWPLLLVLSMIPTLLVVNVCILLFGVIEASTDPFHKTAKCRPKTWSESLFHMSWSVFAFITGINRAKGCLAILQYGLHIYVAALLTGHSVKPMLTDTRSTTVRFRNTGVPYFAVNNLQASAMHVVTGPKRLGSFGVLMCCLQDRRGPQCWVGGPVSWTSLWRGLLGHQLSSHPD